MHHGCIHRIPGGSGYVGNYHAVLSEEPVDYGRLPHIGAAYYGYAGPVILLISYIGIGKLVNYLIQQLSEAGPALSGYGYGVPHAEAEELIDIILLLLEAVHLIDAEDQGLAALPQHICNMIISVCHSIPDIGQEDYDIRRIYGYLCLFPHLTEYHIV